MTDLEQFTRLLVHIDAGQPIPHDLREWFTVGAESFLNGEEKTLCKALGLRGPGRSSVLKQRQQARRNAWLRKAYNHVSLNGVGRWEHCKRLADAILQFETRIWPRVLDLSSPPDRLTELQKCLFNARKADQLPFTPEQISNICRLN